MTETTEYRRLVLFMDQVAQLADAMRNEDFMDLVEECHDDLLAMKS